MKLALRVVVFWIAAVTLGGGYAGVGMLDAYSVQDAYVVALR
ncbi:MAG: hypothetical protein AAF718_09770 [Pseudomonadota bacterium]